jgi:RimJ/RimL family protein N-acetyltransferase
MTEAAEDTTDYWFGTLGQPVLRIFKAVENEASRRISLTQGMRCVATAEKDYVCGRLLSEVWEITAEEWRVRRKLA